MSIYDPDWKYTKAEDMKPDYLEKKFADIKRYQEINHYQKTNQNQYAMPAVWRSNRPQKKLMEEIQKPEPKFFF